MSDNRPITRRRFLKNTVATTGAAFAAPYFIPSGVLARPGQPGANDRVIIGFIGSGGRGQLLMEQMPKGGKIVAACDCDLPRARHASQRFGEGKWSVYQDYRTMLEKEKLDAVVIATTDHGRPLPCIHACQAGLDVYAEKPLTVTIPEGRAMVNAARKYKRVFQVGTQQRSMEMNRYACELVRTGKLGKIKYVQTVQYPGPEKYQGGHEDPVPEGLDWDMWVGPTKLWPYANELRGRWMNWWAYSGGEMTNWGAHGLDQVQCALGTDDTGPIEIWPVTGGKDGKVTLKYASGIEVRCELEKGGPMGGAKFIGEKGSILIDRNGFVATPNELAKGRPPPEAAQIWEGHGWKATLHMANWLDCIKTREKPVSDVEVGHRSVTVCHLANVARQLGRKLHWDPEKERFNNDDEANTYIDRPRRKGYELPEKL